jgi:hypothetical protein
MFPLSPNQDFPPLPRKARLGRFLAFVFLVVATLPVSAAAPVSQVAYVWAPTSTADSSSHSFGSVVALAGNDTIVGYPRDATGGSNAGSVYVYHGQAGSLSNTQVLRPSDAHAGNIFGVKVVAAGGVLLVRAADVEPANGARAAHWYSFQRSSSGTWTEEASWHTPAMISSMFMGAAGALSADGQTAALTTWVNGTAQYVYIYHHHAQGSWALGQTIYHPTDPDMYWFGKSATFGPDFLAVGGHSKLPDGHSGGVMTYLLGASGEYGRPQKISPPDPAAEMGFGAALAAYGDYLVVGAPSDSRPATTAGSAYVYHRGSDGRWISVQKLGPNPTIGGENFGYSLALTRDFLAVGAPLDGHDAHDQGAIYEFSLCSPGNWASMGRVAGSPGKAGDMFGYAVAASGEQVAVTATSNTTGRAYLLQEPSPPPAGCQLAQAPLQSGGQTGSQSQGAGSSSSSGAGTQNGGSGSSGSGSSGNSPTSSTGSTETDGSSGSQSSDASGASVTADVQWVRIPWPCSAYTYRFAAVANSTAAEWDYGDGTLAAGLRTNHTYASAGRYPVNVTLHLQDGTLRNVTSVLDAQPGCGTTGTAPTQATFASGMITWSVPETCSAVSLHGNASGSSYQWDFGDATFGEGADVNHTFAANGMYQVHLLVRDSDGNPIGLYEARINAPSACPHRDPGATQPLTSARPPTPATTGTSTRTSVAPSFALVLGAIGISALAMARRLLPTK